MRFPARRSLLATLLATLLAAGCDETFQPLEPSELSFSVFGFLDAAADTQWIRVMPLRSLITTSPEPLEARVTLENVRTGRVITLRDSVFRFGTPDVGSEGRFLHNFWTTERLEAGASYRFSASRGAGNRAETVVTIPRDFETEVWIGQGPNARDFLWLGGLRYVAQVSRTMQFYDNCGESLERVVVPHSSAEADVQMVAISPQPLPRPACGTPIIESRELSVAGSGNPWPTGRSLQTGRLGTPDDSSSISSSVGFLGGVLSKVVPYESCQLLGTGPATDPCKLRYDAASATLLGTTRDVSCDRRSVPRVEVRLQEIDAGPNARPKLRTLLSTRVGEFTVGALEPGKRYALTLQRLHPAFRYPQFQDYADTLEFLPGQRLVYDADMVGIEPCSDPP